MSQSLDLSQFPDLPPEVVKAFAAVEFELSVECAARQHEQAVAAEKEAFITELKDLIAKLEGQVQDYRRTKFGPKSEKLDPAQLELALEDQETAIAETQAQIAALEDRMAASERDPEKRKSRAPRKARALSDSLPRVERVLEPDSILCPCGCGDMVRIGEDRTERLDYIPARYQVVVTIRPRYACPKGRTGVVQAKAPAHLLEGSWPTEALLAQVAVSKHSEHMPQNRQAVVMARHGVPIDRSVLADWMGRTGALIAPVVDHMAKQLLTGSTRLYVDETTAPVLDPGRGKTKTGYLWAVLRDDRGWNGPAPPGVVFHYRPGRKGAYAAEILTGFNGTIQVDAYGAYTHLATPKRPGGDPLRLAFCWAHGRRKLIEAPPKKGSPIVDAALPRSQIVPISPRHSSKPIGKVAYALWIQFPKQKPAAAMDARMGEILQPVIPGLNKSLRAESRTDRLTGNPGAVLMQEVLEASSAVTWMGDRFHDTRRQTDVVHDLTSHLRTTVLLAAQGWRDHNDADALQHDPAIRLETSSSAELTPLMVEK
jgi:transposase